MSAVGFLPRAARRGVKWSRPFVRRFRLTHLRLSRRGTQVDALLDVALRSNLVEKLVVALHGCLFLEQDLTRCESVGDGETPPPPPPLEQDDHLAVRAVHEFLQNVHQYSMRGRAEEYRAHLLCDTPLVPLLVLPYLQRCAARVAELAARVEQDRAAIAALADDGDDAETLAMVAEVGVRCARRQDG